jgi:hypothetical protein
MQNVSKICDTFLRNNFDPHLFLFTSKSVTFVPKSGLSHFSPAERDKILGNV